MDQTFLLDEQKHRDQATQHSYHHLHTCHLPPCGSVLQLVPLPIPSSRLRSPENLHIFVEQALLSRGRPRLVIPSEKGGKVDTAGVVDRIGRTEDEVIEADSFDAVIV